MKKHKRERADLRRQVQVLQQSVQVERVRAGAAESLNDQWRGNAADWGRKMDNLRADLERVREQRDEKQSALDAVTVVARRYRCALVKVKTTRNAAGHPTVDRLKALAREAIDEAR